MSVRLESTALGYPGFAGMTIRVSPMAKRGIRPKSTAFGFNGEILLMSQPYKSEQAVLRRGFNKCRVKFPLEVGDNGL